jgi:farnesyl diphosphate synthase
MDWIAGFNAHFMKRIEEAPLRSQQLRNAMIYAAKSPGKRLRPLFVHEAGTLIGLPEVARLNLGSAIECVHLFSLIHDDLPALDNDDFRRGLPTLHKQFDEGTALLAGDELLNFAYVIFSELASFCDSQSSFPLALRYFANAVGGLGMIGGQMREIEILADPLKQSDEGAELETLLSIQDLKTGALFRASILTPLLLKGIPPESKSFQEFESYANAFGFAFQIADDLDDEAQDAAQSRKNILSLLGKQNAIDLALKRLDESPHSLKFTATALLKSKLLSKLQR